MLWNEPFFLPAKEVVLQCQVRAYVNGKLTPLSESFHVEPEVAFALNLPYKTILYVLATSRKEHGPYELVGSLPPCKDLGDMTVAAKKAAVIDNVFTWASTTTTSYAPISSFFDCETASS